MDYNAGLITERILFVAKQLELKDAELARELGVPRQNVSQMRNNTISVVAKRVIAFLGKHREINTDWLLFGEGEMFGKPGVHKFTMTSDGDMHFSSENTEGRADDDEIEKLKAIVEEKENHNSSLKSTINQQNEYIKTLLEKL